MSRQRQLFVFYNPSPSRGKQVPRHLQFLTMARTFLTVVGFAYLLLAAWCFAQPEKTSNAVGFELRPGSGQSEYMTVYGGLQLGLGLLFLLPWLRPESLMFVLLASVLIHGSLLAARAMSLLLYSEVSTTTWSFAASELVLFVLSLLLWNKQM